jgi:hypothetical protein
MLPNLNYKDVTNNEICMSIILALSRSLLILLETSRASQTYQLPGGPPILGIRATVTHRILCTCLVHKNLREIAENFLYDKIQLT